MKLLFSLFGLLIVLAAIGMLAKNPFAGAGSVGEGAAAPADARRPPEPAPTSQSLRDRANDALREGAQRSEREQP